MMISYAQFFALYATSIIIAVYVCVRFMAGRLLDLFPHVVPFLRRNYLMIIVLAMLPLMVQFLSVAKAHLSDGHALAESLSNGHILFSVGGGLITTLQRDFGSELISGYFKFQYMWVFAFFTYLLPILFVVKRDRKTLLAFTIALTVNYAILLSFYVAFPAAVSSRLPQEGVKPVLYSSAYWGSMASSVDCLTNCFPSGHVSLSFTALFVVGLAGREYRWLTIALGVSAVSIAIAVLYLGIHYPLDVLGGLALAGSATVAARNDTVRAAIFRTVDRFKSVRSKSSS